MAPQKPKHMLSLQDCKTALHMAAASTSGMEILQWLIEEKGMDPTDKTLQVISFFTKIPKSESYKKCLYIVL